MEKPAFDHPSCSHVADSRLHCTMHPATRQPPRRRPPRHAYRLPAPSPRLPRLRLPAALPRALWHAVAGSPVSGHEFPLFRLGAATTTLLLSALSPPPPHLLDLLCISRKSGPRVRESWSSTSTCTHPYFPQCDDRVSHPQGSWRSLHSMARPWPSLRGSARVESNNLNVWAPPAACTADPAASNPCPTLANQGATP